MKILSVETSTRNFSLAVSDKDQVISYRNIETGRILSSVIIPTIRTVLKKSGVPLSKIDGFAVGLGPGYFTSLRVGLATVKSLAYATGKPVVGVSSLDVIASASIRKEVERLCVITDARRQMVYAGLYDVGKSGFRLDGDYRLCPIDELIRDIQETTYFTGDGIELFRDRLKRSKHIVFEPQKIWRPRAAGLAKLAYPRFKAQKYDDINTLTPLYLYPEDCQVSKK